MDDSRSELKDAGIFAVDGIIQQVGPTAELLTHTNLIVCAIAAKTLGDIGPPAKPAVDKLKAVLVDSPLIDLPVAAACALCAIGEGKEEAVAVIKRVACFHTSFGMFLSNDHVAMFSPRGPVNSSAGTGCLSSSVRV